MAFERIGRAGGRSTVWRSGIVLRCSWAIAASQGGLADRKLAIRTDTLIAIEKDRLTFGRRTKAGLALAIVIVACVVLASLRGGGEGGPLGGGPLNAIAQAAEKTRHEPGGRVAVRMVASSPGSKPTPMWGQMVYDAEDRIRAVLTVLPPGSDESFQMNMVADGTTMYMNSRRFGSLPGDAKWMKLDLEFAQGPESPVPADPDAMGQLELLETVSDDISKLGREKIRGVETTHYRGTIPVATQADRLREVGADELAERSEKDGVPTAIEAWVDDQGLMRRIKIVQTTPQVEGEGTTTMDMRMDFSDFGLEPVIEVPDSAEVFDATSLAEEGLEDR